MSCFCEKKCCDAQAFFGRLAPISRARVRVPCRPCTRTSFAGPEHASSARTRVAGASVALGGGPPLDRTARRFGGYSLPNFPKTRSCAQSPHPIFLRIPSRSVGFARDKLPNRPILKNRFRERAPIRDAVRDPAEGPRRRQSAPTGPVLSKSATSPIRSVTEMLRRRPLDRRSWASGSSQTGRRPA